MVNSITEIQKKAKFAYELARFKSSLWPVFPSAFLMLLGAWLCGSKLIAVCFPILIAIICIYFLWRGRDYGKAVIPSFAFAFIALLIPALLHKFDICCQYDIEMYVCTGTGIVLGFLHAIAPVRNRKLGWEYLLSGAVIISLAGAMSCSYLGYAGILGVTLGVFVTSIVTYLLLPRRP